MAQIINTNVASLNAQRNLDISQNSLKTSLQRLSSGLRINSSKDDAAGLAIAEKMSSQSRGMTVAMRNANDGISTAQTAEAGLATVATHLQRMRELATQAASGQYDSANRAALDKEYQALGSEISRAIGASRSAPRQPANPRFRLRWARLTYPLSAASVLQRVQPAPCRIWIPPSTASAPRALTSVHCNPVLKAFCRNCPPPRKIRNLHAAVSWMPTMLPKLPT